MQNTLFFSFLLLYTSNAFSQDRIQHAKLAEELSRLRPYTTNLVTSKPREVCKSKKRGREKKCVTRYEAVPNKELMSQLKRDLIDTPYFQKFREKCQNTEKLSKADTSLCSELSSLARFLEISEDFNQCRQGRWQDDAQLDRSLKAAGDVLSCESCDANADYSSSINRLSEDFSDIFRADRETREFLRLHKQLTYDAVKQSVKTNMLYRSVLGETPSQLKASDLCKALGKEKADQTCSKSQRLYIEKHIAKIRSNIPKISKAKIKARLNEKIDSLNELNNQYQKKVKELDQSIQAAWSKKSRRQKNRSGRSLLSGKKRQLKTAMDQWYDIKKEQIINDLQEEGIDELALLPEFKDRLKVRGEKLKALTDKDVRQLAGSAIKKTGTQINKLMDLRSGFLKKLKQKRGGLSYNDIKKDLTKLVRSNPVSVGKILATHPEYSDNLCKINSSMRTEDFIDTVWDTSFFVVGVGVGVASLIASGGMSMPVVLAVAGSASIGLAGAEIAVSQSRINESKERQDEIMAAVLSQLGDDASLTDLKLAYEAERTNRTQRNLAIILAPLEIFSVVDIAKGALRISNQSNSALKATGELSPLSSAASKPDAEKLKSQPERSPEKPGVGGDNAVLRPEEENKTVKPKPKDLANTKKPVNSEKLNLSALRPEDNPELENFMQVSGGDRDVAGALYLAYKNLDAKAKKPHRDLVKSLMEVGIDKSRANLLASQCLKAKLCLKSNKITPLTSPVVLKARNTRSAHEIFESDTAKQPELLQGSQRDIKRWLMHLEKSVDRAKDNKEAYRELQKTYTDNYVMKAEDVPESYFNLQKRIARERGNGDIELSASQRKQLAANAIQTQKQSLDEWLDYLVNDQAARFPTWLKHWTLEGVTSLGKYNDEIRGFEIRNKGTVAAFPEVEREALAKVMSDMNDYKTGSKTTDVDAEYFKFLKKGSFGDLYSYQATKLRDIRNKSLAGGTEGRWVKYEKASDPEKLKQDLSGCGTGWCTAEGNTAAQQLQEGDFHVFYSLDSSGKPAIPRVAIRKEGDRIAEVRGVGKDQNMDDRISNSPVLTEKLAEFGAEGERYLKADSDMKRLTIIDNKVTEGGDLSTDELRFLYEVDGIIVHFGYKRDERVDQILRNRDKRKDLSKVFGVKPNEISLTKSEFLQGGKKIHFGGLDLQYQDKLEEVSLPDVVLGNLDLSRLKSTKNLKLPNLVGGSLYLGGLTSAQGLKLPNVVGGNLELSGLTSAKGVKLPGSVGRHLNLRGLTSAKGVKLPDSVGGNLVLNGLTSAKELKLPDSVGRDLYLRGLTSAKDLKLPDSVGGDLVLDGLTSAKGLKLPDSVGRDLHLNGLTSAKDLKLPGSVGGDLLLRGLTSAKNLKLPSTVKGIIYFNKLLERDELVLPPGIKKNQLVFVNYLAIKPLKNYHPLLRIPAARLWF
ncbi:MAG: hypothetical protein AB8E15_12745 [Bdellovibrionales bacterium]